jgi:hypothetical protein
MKTPAGLERLVLFLVLCLAIVTTKPADADWINEAEYSCSDPINLSKQAFVQKWFPTQLPVRRVVKDAEHVHIEVDQKLVNDGVITVGALFTANKFEMAAGDAAMLKVYLKGQERKVDFPLWSQQITALAGFATEAAGGFVLSVLFSYFFDQMGAIKASISAVEVFVADGGEVYQIGSLNESNGRQIFSEIVEYVVKLGRETRFIALYSCSYPAITVMKRVRTVTPQVNKKLFIDTGTDWVMENADTGAVERHFKKIGEDTSFYYFQEAGASPDLAQNLRISRIGGPVQMKIAGTWQSLYSATELF